MRRKAREEPREAGRFCAEVCNGTHADDAVRVVAEYVPAISREVGGLLEIKVV